ncbi:hypothetical protein BX600DRAFT_64547 [Xylariales sp. PMI_506]|nr:hypothetical protein BX600DRAFT_64547 [Xylariales sp. PMI_506]
MPRIGLTVRARLLAGLEAYAGMTPEDVDLFTYLVTASDYMSRSDSLGGLCRQGEKHFRADGTEHTFEDVPVPKIMEAVEAHIWRYVADEEECTLVFDLLQALVKDHDKGSGQTSPGTGSRDKPDSNSPTAKRTRLPHKSNVQLIIDLQSAANMDDDAINGLISMITQWEGVGSNDALCTLDSDGYVSSSPPVCYHTIEDVPNNQVRDNIMDYINRILVCDEIVKDSIRQGVFDSLSAKEITAYSSKIQQASYDKVKMKEAAAREIIFTDPDEEPPVIPPRSRRRKTVNAAAPGVVSTSIKPEEESELKLETVLAAIDETISLTPLAPRPDIQEGYAVRDFNNPGPILGSVIQPGLDPRQQSDRERALNHVMRAHDNRLIDRDCDQIRAMVKLFCITCSHYENINSNSNNNNGSSSVTGTPVAQRHHRRRSSAANTNVEAPWTLDQFLAVCSLTLPKLIAFLKQRGPMEGITTDAYALCWEFFRRREKLGLPAVPPPPPPPPRRRRVAGVLRELDMNSGSGSPNGNSGSNKRKVGDMEVLGPERPLRKSPRRLV